MVTGLVCLLLLAAVGRAQAQGSPNAPGATTPAQAQTTEGGLQQLSAPAGQNLRADAGLVQWIAGRGKATEAVLDLSLDDAVARGLRQTWA